MAFADLAEDASTDMSLPLYLRPKYAGTFRKVAAGLVSGAGISMSSCLKLARHFMAEGVQFLHPFPPVCRTSLKEEVQNQLFGVVMSLPGTDAVEHSQQFMPYVLGKTLGTCQIIL